MKYFLIEICLKILIELSLSKVLWIGDFDSEFGFDIWLLETAQFCLIFISKGWSFLKKIIQGQQRPKRPMKAKKGHQRPELQKIIDFINIQCKIINKWECKLRKSCFSKIGNFHFHNIKFLKLHFVKNIKIAGFCW